MSIQRYCDAIMSNPSSYSIQSFAEALFIRDWSHVASYKHKAEDAVFSGVGQKLVSMMKNGQHLDAVSMAFANWTVIGSSTANEALVRMGAVDALVPYITQKDATGLMCMMSAANLVGHDEEKSHLLSTGPDVVDEFITVLEASMRGRSIHGLVWTVEELLMPAANLAINDNNKRHFANDRTLNLLKQIFESKSTEDSGSYAVLVLLELSFESSGRVISWMKSSGTVNSLNSMKNSMKLKEANEAIDKLLFKLEEKRSAPTSARSSGKKNVFVSYNWTYQDTIKEVVAELKSAGFEVWFDLEQMSGNIMDAMAEGIEDCDCAVMSICPEYKDSANCRFEADYICQLKKPVIPLMMKSDYRARGWLGLILGQKLWYDCSSSNKFHQNKDALIADVKRQAGMK